jgi:hypothetical protein
MLMNSLSQAYLSVNPLVSALQRLEIQPPHDFPNYFIYAGGGWRVLSGENPRPRLLFGFGGKAFSYNLFLELAPSFSLSNSQPAQWDATIGILMPIMWI